MFDHCVNVETLAAVLGVSRDTITRRVHRGVVPAPDIHTRSELAWRLSAIERWNPQAAARIRRGLESEIFALRPAA